MIRLFLTCSAFPEQYMAFLGDEPVGYLRLRDGRFRVNCPDPDGIEMFAAYPRGDGEFEPVERDHFLRLAVQAILIWHQQVKINPDDARYMIETGERTGEIDFADP